MTLELNGVPEQQALEVVLRSASGFLALARTIARADSSSSMTSRFERILVLPASAAPPSPGALTAGQVNVQPPAAQIPQMPPGTPGPRQRPSLWALRRPPARAPSSAPR